MTKQILYIDLDNTMVDFRSEFEGEWLHFGPGNAYPDWDAVLGRLLPVG